MTAEDGAIAAKACAIALRPLKAVATVIERLVRVKLVGFVKSTPDFTATSPKSSTAVLIFMVWRWVAIRAVPCPQRSCRLRRSSKSKDFEIS
jgi:hypothetical protein